MSAIDVESLLKELSSDSPCGDNLEYDSAFVELEDVAKGKPEQQMGETIVPAEDPDWRIVRGKALELLARSKDLRVMLYLCRAISHTDGLVGLCDSLALLKGILQQHWQAVHPQLDPEDDNDPTLRVNTVAQLCDPETMLRYVREAPLVSSRALGRFSLRDFDIATGKVPPPASGNGDGDGAPPEMSTIEAAFMDCELDELQATADSVGRSIKEVVAIEGFLTDQIGVGSAPNLSAFTDALKEAQKVLGEQLTRRGVTGATNGEGSPAADGGASGRQAASGEINSREDVVRMLEKACKYFRNHEPSSPVPLLLERAKRLASKSFLEIIRDMAPDGMSQVEKIGGVDGGD